MQLDAQLWFDLLLTSGGLLELDRCSYHFIYYQFLEDTAPIMSSHRQGPKLCIRQENNNHFVDIKYKNPYDSHKTLGHYKALGGRNKLKDFI
eukprot:3515939-Ditylum_brightwellii.AAC.1